MLRFDDLLAFSLQVAMVACVGLLVTRLLLWSRPRAHLFSLYGVLLLALAGPFVPMGFVREPVPIGTGELWMERVVALGGTTGLERLVPGLVLVLAAGALARLARSMVGLHSLWRLRREAAPLEAALPLAELGGGSAISKVRCYQSDAVSVPLTFGLRRPAVVVPSSFSQLSSVQQRAVLCHELLHVRRHDWCTALAEELLRIVLWFHPAVHVLLSRISVCREQVVDHEVVRVTGQRRPYLEAMLRVARTAGAMPASPTPALFRRRELLERIRLMQKEASMPTRRLIAFVSVVAALVVAAAVASAAAFPIAAFAAGPLPAVAVQEESEESEESEEPRPIFVTKDVQRPEKLSDVVPEYTEIAREARIQGTVILQLVIDRKGRVHYQKTHKALPMGLTDNAIEAVKQWRYRPATLDGEPVAVYFNVTINFVLRKECPEGQDCESDG